MKISSFSVGKADAHVLCYLHDSLVGYCETLEHRPAILLIPGGGYRRVSPREADPVAMRFFSHGIDVFTLTYSCGSDIARSKPIFEAAEALCTIRRRAEEFLVDADRTCAMGFSAGAHLALSLAAFSGKPLLESYPEARPSCVALLYPVVTSGPYAHGKSFDELCSSEEERRFYSLENQIDGSMVPTFLLHAADDAAVPVENSLLLAMALSRHHVPFECHVYPEGGHGFSTATREVGKSLPALQGWPELCLDWLKRVWNYPE